MKVYIADRSKLFRDFLLTRLSGMPEVEVIGHAGNAFEAIRSLKDLRPEVVMLENRLSGGRVFDVLKKIKSLNPSVKIIMLAHNAKAEDAEKFFSAGVDFFLDKSFDVDDIVSLFKTFH